MTKDVVKDVLFVNTAIISFTLTRPDSLTFINKDDNPFPIDILVILILMNLCSEEADGKMTLRRILRG
jgi:hypothetical protein